MMTVHAAMFLGIDTYRWQKEESIATKITEMDWARELLSGQEHLTTLKFK